MGSLQVKRVPNSRLIDVSFDAEDPQLAAQVVNAHLQNYIEQNFRSKYDATTQASKWLSSELEELRIKVEKSEDDRLAYERSNQIWQIDDKQDITTQKLGDLSKSVTEAQTALAQKEALYRMATSGNVDALPEITNSAFVQDLTKKKNDLDQAYADALNQYGPNYPKVQRLAEQQKQVDGALATARKAMIDGITEDYRTALSHVQLLQDALDKQKAETNDLAEKLVQYHILQHDADSNKQLYDGMLQKLKEAGITAGLRSSNIRVVDPALVPTYPSRPQKARNILLAVLVGLVGGVGLALFREYLDNTVKSPDDVENLTGLPSLAVVPSMPILNGHGSRHAETGSRGGGGWWGARLARGNAFPHAAQVPDLGSISRPADFLAAFAGRPSATGNSGDQRLAARREDDRCSQFGRDIGAARRPHPALRLRPPQARSAPRPQPPFHERGWAEFLPRGCVHARGGDLSASCDQQPECVDYRPGAAEPRGSALLAAHARRNRRIAAAFQIHRHRFAADHGRHRRGDHIGADRWRAIGRSEWRDTQGSVHALP